MIRGRRTFAVALAVAGSNRAIIRTETITNDIKPITGLTVKI